MLWSDKKKKSLSPENANTMLWSFLASQTMKQMNIYSVQNTWSNIGHYTNSKWIKTSPQIRGTILLPLETYSKQQNNVALLPQRPSPLQGSSYTLF